jgi:hypothetical protein
MAVAHHSGRRAYCGCTSDTANRVSSRAIAPCDNPVETYANHFWITSYSLLSQTDPRRNRPRPAGGMMAGA